MYQFVETIRIKDGMPMNLNYHAERMNRTLSHFHSTCPPVSSSELLQDIPQEPGLQKARVVYTPEGITLREFHPYTIRNINTIKVVTDDSIDYTWKSTDRSVLTRQRDKAPDADEVIIVRNGCVTDTSYTNLCFYDGNRWLTPDTPLLRGTMRQSLLDRHLIHEAHILASYLTSFSKVCLINAMMDLGDMVLPIDRCMGIIP